MWKKVKLKDVCKIVNGGTPKSNVKEYWGGEIQWLTPKDMGKLNSKYVDATERKITVEGLDNSSAKLVPENSLILSCRAPIGHVFINSIEMSFNQGCKALLPSVELDIDYLYYFVYSSRQLLNDLGTGTTFKEISSKTLGDVEIPLPPLAEQQRIVSKLDAALAEIDKAIQIQSMRAEEASNLKASLLTTSLNDDTGVWKSVTIGDLYNVGSSKRVLKADWKTSGIPFYRGREVTKLSVDGYVENDLFITDEHYQSLSSKSGVPNTDDIMITAIGTIGNTYIVQPNDKFYFKDASVLWLRKKADVSSKYVQYWLKTDCFFSQLDKGNGATVDTLTIKKLASVELPFPPLAEQQRIVSMLDTVFSEIEAIASALSATKANYSLLKSAILAQELNPSEAA